MRGLASFLQHARPTTNREQHGGRATIMADHIAARSIRASLAQTCLARIVQHRQGTGPDLCARYRLHRLVWAERGARIVRGCHGRSAKSAMSGNGGFATVCSRHRSLSN
jgi:hypothetical protein